MNEELKIIIKAVTDGAKKGIEGVRKELEGVQKGSGKAGASFGTAVKGIAKGAAIAVAAIAAIGAALIALGKNSLEYNKAQAKLITGFQAVGMSAQQAATSYNGLYRFLGDSDKAVEAAGHLARLTQNEKNLAEWTKITQGVYATFGDSISTEGLTESANETARVGKLTGALTDALNWAGVSEDEFNAKLAQTTTLEQREALIRETLNGLYSDAAEIYERNNRDILEYNESQARMEASMGAAGRSVYPLMTALNNLSAALLDALKPALDVIIPALATFIDWITKGIETVLAFFGVMTGQSASVNTMTQLGAATGGVAQGFDQAAASAEKAKRATMGFDELNIVSSGSSGGGSGGGPAYAGGTGLGSGSQFSAEVQDGAKTASGFAQAMQKIGDTLKDVFEPTVTAWTGAFDTLKATWEDTKPRFINGARDITDAFRDVGSYVVGTFIPDVVNSFSTELAPMIGDYMSFVLDGAGKDFEAYGYVIKDTANNILIPALDSVKNVATGIFDAFGKAWEQHGQPIIDKATQAFDHLRSTIVRLYDEFIKPIIQNVISMFNELWNNHLKPLVDKIVEAAMEIGECLLDLYNEFIAPIVDWIVKNVFPVLKDWINSLVDLVGRAVGFLADALGGVVDVLKGLVQFITGVFTGDWNKAWEGIKNIFKGVWDAIVGIAKSAWELIKYPFENAGEFFGRIWNAIKNAFSNVSSWFGTAFSTAWTAIKNAWSGAGSWFSSRWSDIKNAFSAVGSWFSSTFTSAYNNVTGAFKNAKSGFANVWSNIKSGFGDIAGWFKTQFTNAWTNVKNVFSTGGKVFDGIKDGILSGLKSVINALIGGINSVIAVPFNGLNDALKKIKNVSIAGIKPFSWMPTISVPQIPKLARGGIVDEATLALIGEKGKEAVVPLENNTEWMDKFIDKLLTRSNGNATIILQIGETELGRAAVRGINNITRQTGVNPLLI